MYRLQLEFYQGQKKEIGLCLIKYLELFKLITVIIAPFGEIGNNGILLYFYDVISPAGLEPAALFISTYALSRLRSFISIHIKDNYLVLSQQITHIVLSRVAHFYIAVIIYNIGIEIDCSVFCFVSGKVRSVTELILSRLVVPIHG